VRLSLLGVVFTFGGIKMDDIDALEMNHGDYTNYLWSR